jgi:hypothetical protein
LKMKCLRRDPWSGFSTSDSVAAMAER